jgi:hypothetical protein
VDRDELEAVLWRHWPTRGTQASVAIDTILAAADTYAAGEPERQERRREAISDNKETERRNGPRPSVHYQPATGKNAYQKQILCGVLTANPKTSSDPDDVTCWRCAASPYFPAKAATG